MNKESSIKNLVYAYIGQVFGIIINFISRIVFIQCLNSEYLGINSLFANIITFLSLTELGVGAAMSFSLYEPIEKNNTEKIKSLMNLYKKYYITIGFTIITLGFCITPFLHLFIKEMPDISGIKFYFMLFVLNSGVSYFYSYKRALIICDRKRYIATFYRYLFYFLLNFSQIILLLITKSYLLFLICQVLFTLFENIAISQKADKLYPYLKEKVVKKLDDESYKKLNRDIKSTFLGRLGGIVISSTDSIVISKFLGVILVGFYSNYVLITTALTTIMNQIFSSITASIGNIGVTRSSHELKKLFDRIFFLNFIVYGIVTVCLVNVMNPFIELWLGTNYVLDFQIVIAIIISFFINGLRVSIVTYKDAMGLYWRDKYRPIITCTANVIISVILVNKIGLLGVVLGTIISSVCVDLLIEPYYIYKYTFESNVIDYYKRYIQYSILITITSVISYYLLNFIIIENLFLKFIIKGFLSFLISAIIIIVIYFKSEEFKYCLHLVEFAINMLKNKFKNKE